ncbi:hypothetical protein EVAR_33922_1 [Eumeta japonica]|uniref:Uncharacterized protein n=1 Tax=Eumeta variegata TaxID=151549 RepID=A0A4C1VZP3_EUMVA|nr:hypothetical protein EVAR_33922_1 [Eumeta japonica]
MPMRPEVAIEVAWALTGRHGDDTRYVHRRADSRQASCIGVDRICVDYTLHTVTFPMCRNLQITETRRYRVLQLKWSRAPPPARVRRHAGPLSTPSADGCARSLKCTFVAEAPFNSPPRPEIDSAVDRLLEYKRLKRISI